MDAQTIEVWMLQYVFLSLGREREGSRIRKVPQDGILTLVCRRTNVLIAQQTLVLQDQFDSSWYEPFNIGYSEFSSVV